MQLQAAQRTKHRPRVRRNLFLKTLLRSLVGNPQAAAGVDVANVVPLFAQGADQIGHTLERLLKCTDIGNLRPDVDAHPGYFQIWLLRGLRVERPRLGNRYPELVLMQADRKST